MKKNQPRLLKINLNCIMFNIHYYTLHVHYVWPKKNIKNLIILLLAFLLNYYHNRQVIMLIIQDWDVNSSRGG